MDRLAGGESINQPIETPVNIDAREPMMLSNVPIDMINYFDINIQQLTDRTRNQLNEIHSILTQGKEPISIYRTLQELELKLGSSRLGETRFGKIWQYLKLHNQIERLQDDKRMMER